MELPLDIKRSIRLFRPVETEGLTLYPIPVSDYEDYLIGKPAIGMMQRSLPVAYLSMPLLQALYQIDFEHRVNGEAPEGWFYRTLLFLSLSLRLEGMKNGGNDLPFLLYADPENPKKLKEIRFFQNGEEKKITPIMFSRLRPILAAQNAIELYGDEVNPELVEAEADVAEAKSTKLDFRIEDMISGVCALCGADESDVEAWPIAKLMQRQKSLRRVMDYMVCAVAEGSGCSWKHGNPQPNPWFDRISDESAGVISMGDFAGGKGYQAMQNAGANTPI